MYFKLSFLILFSALVSATIVNAQEPATKEVDAEQTALGLKFASRVQAITHSDTSAGRMAAITKILDDRMVAYRVEPFELDEMKGKNLIVEIGPKADKTILLGAHFDQVGVGQGAVDNACSCVLLVDMIERFRAKPLKNHALNVIFFDLEEAGLIGSKAYVKSLKDTEQPEHFLNFDIFGYGDSLWLMKAETGDAMETAIAKAGKEAELPVIVSGAKEYPPGDHLSFVESSISTVAVALIDQAEIPKVQSLLKGERIAPPPILRTIHSPDDNIAKIDSKEVARAIPVVETAIRRLDAP